MGGRRPSATSGDRGTPWPVIDLAGSATRAKLHPADRTPAGCRFSLDGLQRIDVHDFFRELRQFLVGLTFLVESALQ